MAIKQTGKWYHGKYDSIYMIHGMDLTKGMLKELSLLGYRIEDLDNLSKEKIESLLSFAGWYGTSD